jgi:formylmethanofuran dehydrogenase subunit C
VTPLILTLRERPEQRLDLSPLVPHLLAGKTATEIAQIELQTTRIRVTVGDVFRLRMGDAQHIRIDEACDRLDRVGAGMMSGVIEAAGDVGVQAGRLMTGGRLAIKGNAHHWAASGMKGGAIEIAGCAGDRLGGPLAGEVAGMRGGLVIVRGGVGTRAGDRLRRGMIVVEGGAGDHAGSRMIAGTLIVRGKAGALPGYLMKRGTIVLGEGSTALSPTFADCGTHRLVAMQLMAGYLKPYGARTAALLRGPLRRFAGDMAVLGNGELFIGNQS